MIRYRCIDSAASAGVEIFKGGIRAFLDEIARLQASDFPYPHGEEALAEINSVFADLLAGLEQLDEESDPTTVRAACASEVSGLFDYLPLLGFILRSTNTRNAFETYKPFLRLARQIVGPETRLLLSSEWEYSPITYLGITHLPDFVLIGFPAHESANPLLIPLGGHELGHTIWASRHLIGDFSSALENIIVEAIRTKHWEEFTALHPDISDKDSLTGDLLARQSWISASDWAARQCEETFCDMIGLRVFGEAYFHAFAYLLSPRPLGARSGLYPRFGRRVQDLVDAAATFALEPPPDFTDLFDDDADDIADLSSHAELLSTLADDAAAALTSRIIAVANTIVSDAGVENRSAKKILQILSDLELVAPAQNSGSLANILNAGWKAFHDDDLWSDVPQITSKETTLRELLLKSVEVLEYEEIVNA